MAAEAGEPQAVPAEPNEFGPAWSPDGARLAVGRRYFDHTSEHPIRLRVLDLQNGRASVIPGSEGLLSPGWSPDGRWLAAVSIDFTRLALYEFATGRWRDLISGSDVVNYPSWTHDSAWVQLRKGSSIVRVRVADGCLEPVAGFERVPLIRTVGSWTWIGIAPDDSPLAIRETTGAAEVYALDVEWP